MIKINLFKSLNVGTSSEGVSEISQVSDSGGVSKLNFLKNLIVMFLGVGALFAYESFNIPTLQSQLNSLQDEINEASTFNNKMNSLKKEIEKYEKDLSRLNTQTEFLQKTQNERMLSVDLITSLKKIVNPKVWITKLTVKDNLIEISGEAETEMDVNRFNNNLINTSFLKDVLTTSVTLKQNNSVEFQMYSYTIRASFIDGKSLINASSTEVKPMQEPIAEKINSLNKSGANQ